MDIFIFFIIILIASVLQTSTGFGFSILATPFLLLLSGWWDARGTDRTEKRPITVPWFAFGFIAVALFNSLHLLPEAAVQALLTLCTLLMTMAMAALGLTTHYSTLKQAGVKPLILAGLLMLWLVLGGGLLQVLLAGY